MTRQTSIIIGPVLGAAHGFGGLTGIPAEYRIKIQNGDLLW